MKKYRIIIVENDEDEQMFMKEGFDATTGLFEIVGQVQNGNALLEWLEKNEDNLPDIILSDLNMPGKNGYDIINEITANPKYQHIPVIITSTSSTRTIIEKCLSQGAADYIVKPETFVEYVPYVQNLHKRISEKELVKD